MMILLYEGLEFKSDCFIEVVVEDFFNVIDVVDYLVVCGVLFWEVYNLVGKVVKICIFSGKLLKDLILEEWKELYFVFVGDIY